MTKVVSACNLYTHTVFVFQTQLSAEGCRLSVVSGEKISLWKDRLDGYQRLYWNVYREIKLPVKLNCLH